MASPLKFQMMESIGKHGPYTFYRSMKAGDRIFSVSMFLPVKIWPDSTILNLADIQLLWTDKSEPFCSLKLYFLPENTPEGRLKQHGEDEVIALQDRVIIRVSDLMSWLVEGTEWDWGFKTPSNAPASALTTLLSKSFVSETLGTNEKKSGTTAESGCNNVVVLNYPRYTRLRTVLKRLEGSLDLENWVSHPLVLAIGGLNIGPNCRILYAKEAFDHPDLEDHELLCNHLAPKLNGRKRKKNRKRNASRGSLSNESESSSTGSVGSSYKAPEKKPLNGLTPKFDTDLKPDLSQIRVSDSAKGRGCSLTDPPLNGLQILKVDNKSWHKGNESAKRSHNNRANGFSGVDHSSLLLASSNSKMGNGSDWERQDTAELLGPALTELAQKLEKSNALQILPIRPPAFENSNDMDNQVPKKRRKTDIPRNDVTVAGNHKMGPYDSRTTAVGPPGIIRGRKFQYDNGNTECKSSQKTPVSAHSSNARTTIKTFKTISNADITWKPLYLPGASPCPYTTTSYRKIYADPYDIKTTAGEGMHIDALDFSRHKKSRQPKNSQDRQEPSNSRSKCNTETDLLDLSAKPHSNSATKYQSLTDIPPPNAMNQLGLRLTSEVTLFPTKNLPMFSSKDIMGQGQMIYPNPRANVTSTVTNPKTNTPEITVQSWKSTSPVVSGSSRNHLTPKEQSSSGHSHSSSRKRGSSSRERNIPSGHSQSYVSKQSGSSSSVSNRDRERKESENLSNLMNNPFINPYFGKVDPAYLQLLGAPHMFMPPAATTGFMGMPPAIEQLYKDFLLQSQGLNPMMPNWFPPGAGAGTDRGSKS